MDFKTIQELKKFSGINNVDDARRLYPDVTDNRDYAFPLTQANNVEIDNTYKIKSRDGYTSLLAGTDIHSLWADGDKCFYVDGQTLYQLLPDFTTITIRTDLTLKARVSYALVNDRVYYTNNYQCGYVHNFVNYSYMNPERQFKQELPAGSIIEIFMSCLFVAVGNIMYISDPLCDYYDIRSGYRIFPDELTMIRALDDGMYVSDIKKTYFLSGRGNDDFNKTEVESEPAIKFSDVRTSAESMGYGVKGDVVIWTSSTGICVGDSGGSVKNMTFDRYQLTEHGRGAAFVKEVGNIKHYINSLY